MAKIDIAHLKQKKNYGEVYKTVRKDYIGNNLLASDVDVVEDYFVNFNKDCCFDVSIKLILVDELRREKDVIEALKSEQNHVVKRAVKCTWFFETLTPEDFASELLPNVSLSALYKITNKLSKAISNNEVGAEKYFQILHTDGRRDIAERFLPFCSGSFIKRYLHLYPLHQEKRHSNNILLQLLKRHFDIGVHEFEQVLKKLKDNFLCSPHRMWYHVYNAEFYKTVLEYILAVNMGVLVHLFDTYHGPLLNFFKCGHVKTRKLMPKYKSSVIKHAHAYATCFKGEWLVGHLNQEELTQFLANYTQHSLEDNELSGSDWWHQESYFEQLAKSLKHFNKYELLINSFQKVFGQNLLDFPCLWSEVFLQTAPLDVRMKCLSIMKEKDDFDERHYLYLHDLSESISKLRQLIVKESDGSKRGEYYKQMIKSCYVNQNKEKLAEVLCLAVDKHRNDDSIVFVSILQQVKDMYPMKDLLPTHWKSIVDMIKVLHFKNTSTYSKWDHFLFSYLHYLMKTNPNTTTVQLFVPLVDARYSWRTLKKEHNIHCTKQVLELILSELLKLEDPSALIMLEIFKDWNKKHKQNKIKASSKLIAFLEKKIESCEFNSLGHTPMLYDELIPLFYPKLIDEHTHISLIHYYIKYDPIFLKTNYEQILQTKQRKTNLKYLLPVKFLEFLNIKETIIEFLVKLYEDEEKQEITLQYLSYIMNVQQFTQFIKDLIPTSFKIDHDDDSQQQLNVLRTICAVYSKSFEASSMKFELIAKFLGGDYLNYVLPAFRSTCYHCHPGTVKQFLLNNIDKPVSVKKNILTYLSLILKSDERIKLLTNLWDTEKHHSIRSLTVQLVQLYFYNEKTEPVWNLLKRTIRESDETILGEYNVTEIPNEYLNECLLTLFTKYKELKDKKLSKEKINVEMIDFKLMKFISDDVALMVIEDIDYPVYHHEERRRAFTAKYIIHKYLKDKDLSFLQELLKRESQIAIKKLYKVFSYILFHNPEADEHLVKLMLDAHQSTFNFYDSVEDTYLLNCLYILRKNWQVHSNPQNVSFKFGLEIGSFFSKLDNNKEFISLFGNSLKLMFKTRVERKILNKFSVLNGILSNKNTICSLLAVHMLYFHCQDEFSWVQCDATAVLDKLKLQQDVVVHAYFKKFVDDMETNNPMFKKYIKPPLNKSNLPITFD